MTIHNDVINEVEHDVHRNEEQLESGKLQWALLVSQVSEWDALEGIYRYGNKHRPYVGRMVGIAHGIAQRLQEDEHQGDEEQGSEAHHAQYRVINLF